MITAVPFVDVLNTMSDSSLPLTPPEMAPNGAIRFRRIRPPTTSSPATALTGSVRNPYPAVLATGALRPLGDLLGAGQMGRPAPRRLDQQKTQSC